MSAGRRSLQFILSLVDRVSGPLGKIQAKLYALGIQQMLLFRKNFHTYGQSAAQAATKVGLITAAIVAATAATSALTAAILPIAGMAVTGIGATMGTANAAGIARETTQLQQKTGMSSEQVLTYRQAGRFVGMEAGMGQLGDMGTAFAEVHTKLKAPDDEFANVLKQVKIPLKEIKGMQPDQFMNKMADQMERLGMNDQMKSKLLDSIIADGSKLLPILGANNAAMQRFRHHANATGAILSDEQIKLMRVASQEWALMKTGVEGYGNSLADVGGNFMKLFGPEINQWLVDNKTEFNRWTQGQIAELKRLHGVFKQGGLQAVYEDLFPNLSAFTGRVGAFVTGFTRSFADPFMASVRNTWASVSTVLGSTAGGAEGFGAAFGAALLPIFTQTIEIIGSTIIWLESNWGIVKQIFAWSPLGLIIDNWSGIVEFLQPINAWIIRVAESMGMVAPGFNAAGNAGGTLFGVLAAIAGVLLLNKLAFGAVYQIVRLYSFAIAILKGLTMLVTVATWAWNAAMLALRVAMIALRAVALVGFLFTIASAMGVAAIATGAMSAATWLFGAAIAVLTSPITLVIAAIAALAAGAYYLYTHWAQVKAYLGETAWGQALLSVINAVTHPLDTFNAAVGWLEGKWTSTKASLAETTWGQMILDAITALFSPFETFKTSIAAAQLVWDSIKNSLHDTSWGQAIIGAIDKIMGLIGKFKEAWGFVKNAASDIGSGALDKIKGAGSWVSSKLGMGGSESAPAAKFGGGRALGGSVLPGSFYRVNEQGPELLQTHGQTFLMTGGAAGTIIPFPAMHERTQSTQSSFTSLSNQPVMQASQSNQNLASVSQIAERFNTFDRSQIATHSNQKLASVSQLSERMSSSNKMTELSDRFSEARERTSTKSLQREAKVLDLRQVMARANNTGQQTNRTAPIGKNISIGEVHIHTHELDAHDFQAQLEMMG